MALSGSRLGARLPKTARCTLAPMSLRMCAGGVRGQEGAGARRGALRGPRAAALVRGPPARRRLRRVRRSGVQAGARGSLRRAVAAAAAALPPVPRPRRLRRRARPPGRRRRAASLRASGAGPAARALASAPRPPLQGGRARRRAGARSAGGRALLATLTTARLAGALAPRPRAGRLLEWSQARGRRSRTPSGVASRRMLSIQRDVWLVLGGVAWVRSAEVHQRRNATCSARRISVSKESRGGMGAWTGQSQRRSCRNSAGPRAGRRARCPRPRRSRRGLCPRLRPRLLRRRSPRDPVLGLLAEVGGVLRHACRRPRRGASTARVRPPLATVRSTLRPRPLHRRLRPMQGQRLPAKAASGVLRFRRPPRRVASSARVWPPMPRVPGAPARPVRLWPRRWAVEAGRPRGLWVASSFVRAPALSRRPLSDLALKRARASLLSAFRTWRPTRRRSRRGRRIRRAGDAKTETGGA